jgi:hypothetical protein
MKNGLCSYEALEVKVEEGSVVIQGPDSLIVTLTREAALDLSDRLFGQAMRVCTTKFI